MANYLDIKGVKVMEQDIFGIKKTKSGIEYPTMSTQEHLQTLQ